MILDAITHASTEHAVYFLVSAYLESFQHCHAHEKVPGDVMRLPLHGKADLQERLRTLQASHRAPLPVGLPMWVASAVLSSALRRLRDVSTAS